MRGILARKDAKAPCRLRATPWTGDEMRSFQSNEEYFEAVAALIGKLELGGHQQAADELRDGYRCLNGLTDGWALFLESVERVQASQAKRFSREDQQALEVIQAAAHKIVYRR